MTADEQVDAIHPYAVVPHDPHDGAALAVSPEPRHRVFGAERTYPPGQRLRGDVD